ncbi:hypothetical protein V6N13_015553 [Hibiscus sabdariffa]
MSAQGGKNCYFNQKRHLQKPFNWLCMPCSNFGFYRTPPKSRPQKQNSLLTATGYCLAKFCDEGVCHGVIILHR